MLSCRVGYKWFVAALAAVPVVSGGSQGWSQAAAYTPPPQARTQEEYEQQLLEYQRALVTHEVRTRIDAFRRAVDTGDRETVAASVCYPARIMFRDRQMNVHDRATFLQYFEAVFTQRFMHTLKEIDWEPQVVGDKGITIGSGQIWFDMNGCVVTINNNWPQF